ncbi:YafY family protein [Bacillus sp. FJAT-49736]|uniref:helix-turn-helix transcriptional regulator n=1 Tax=Bacillus sp. FJAT-49736 TaxID=2833582 RepID=UPI001BC9E797|nr:YafY family protein [Bacillus sp. FJAT-49736]MBS4174263.1 YafY family transcriptional regulator [Bacillus sp. FJAT-49736]
MKLDRLLAMTMILINRRRVRAQELAEMFEVSIRTIYRDIETLGQAGIPVVTFKGSNGGIGLMDGYRLDKNVLTEEELNAISTALKSVSTSFHDEHGSSVLEKIKGITGEVKKESIVVDFSPWGQNEALRIKVDQLKEAIEASICVKFNYSSSAGQGTERTVEPHMIILKGKAWYLYAHCQLRGSFRLFKISRIRNLQLTKVVFSRKEFTIEEIPWEKEWFQSSSAIKLTLSFDESLLASVEDMFDAENVIKGEDGRYLVVTEMPEDDWLYGFLLSFLDKLEVLDPPHVREKLLQITSKMENLYKNY